MTYLKDRRLFIIFFIALICIIFLIFIGNKNKVSAQVEDDIENVNTNEEIINISKIKVEIKGAVQVPGVYELEEGSRVIDLINISGGLTSDANTEYINLSKILKDEMSVKIYSNSEIESSSRVEVVTKYVEKECKCPTVTNDSCINPPINKDVSNDKNNNNLSTGSNLVNINTASVEELQSLPGIGEGKAISIVEYRKTESFKTIEDIKNVSGIGQSLYDKIKDHIEV